MKRFFISIACLLLAVGAGAQDSYFAELLSRNNYYGTARSVALGGAMTALGGDLGSIGINPAGGAVNSFGQFTITPALLFQNTGAAWSADGTENFGSPLNTSHTKFNMPNCGGTMVLYSDDSEGLKYMTFGFLANNTNTFLNYTTGRGVNSSTSFLANLAAGAAGMESSDMPDDLYTAFCANQFGAYGMGNNYMGANQRWAVPVSGGKEQWDKAWTYVPGAVDQTAIYNTYGSKTDMLFNMSFNFSDNFYLGFNLGIPILQYRREEVFGEYAQTPVLFPNEFYTKEGAVAGVSNYLQSKNGYKLNTDAAGIYAKVGFIYLPTEHLRIGAAFQTPTTLMVDDQWQYSASSTFENSKFNGSAYSDVRDDHYRLRTPYVVDAGIAYTFGAFGLLSVDYELTDYSVMKYRSVDYYSFEDGSWDFTNMVNRTFCGVSHSLRVGAEVKPLPELSLRAGYSLVTDPEKFCTDATGNIVTAETYQDARQLYSDMQYFKNKTKAFSFGVGYSSPGSFFCDAAVRMTKYPTVYYSPYYYGSYAVYDKDSNLLDVGFPYEKLDRKILDVVLTLGWRF